MSLKISLITSNTYVLTLSDYQSDHHAKALKESRPHLPVRGIQHAKLPIRGQLRIMITLVHGQTALSPFVLSQVFFHMPCESVQRPPFENVISLMVIRSWSNEVS